MIGFFPRLLPDELLFSAVARYSRLMAFSGREHVALSLLGRKGTFPSRGLPCHLGTFVSRLLPGHVSSASQLIDDHTLFPLYAPFLGRRKREEIRWQMEFGKAGSTMHPKVDGAHAYFDGLRYCPICVAEDRHLHGQTYWHRSHQIPGINLCPTHLAQLFRFSIQPGEPLITAEETLTRGKGTPMTVYLGHFYDGYESLAEDVKFLFTTNTSYPERDALAETYFDIAARIISTGTPECVARRLCESEHRRLLGSPPVYKLYAFRAWTQAVPWSRHVPTPVRHALLCQYLGTSLAEVLPRAVAHKSPQPPPPSGEPLCLKKEELPSDFEGGLYQ